MEFLNQINPSVKSTQHLRVFVTHTRLVINHLILRKGVSYFDRTGRRSEIKSNSRDFFAYIIIVEFCEKTWNFVQPFNILYQLHLGISCRSSWSIGWSICLHNHKIFLKEAISTNVYNHHAGCVTKNIFMYGKIGKTGYKIF